jgi:uncharacterized protein (DUF4415 family)
MLMSAHNTVKFKLDPKRPKPPNAAQRKRLTAVAAMPDSAIDYSDIPRQTLPIQWTRPSALVSAENKQQITLRLDAEVVSFFKKTGKRYQSRINAALREYVKAHRKSA